MLSTNCPLHPISSIVTWLYTLLHVHFVMEGVNQVSPGAHMEEKGSVMLCLALFPTAPVQSSWTLAKWSLALPASGCPVHHSPAYHGISGVWKLPMGLSIIQITVTLHRPFHPLRRAGSDKNWKRHCEKDAHFWSEVSNYKSIRASCLHQHRSGFRLWCYCSCCLSGASQQSKWGE